MDAKGFASIQELNLQLGAVGMVLRALVRSHPAPAEFARELRELVAQLQVKGAAAGAALTPEARQVLDPLLAIADVAAQVFPPSPKQG